MTSTTTADTFEELLRDLEDLWTQEREDDDGILRPTPHALITTGVLLLRAYLQAQTPWPFGAVTTDSEGGIAIEWRSLQGEIRLRVHACDEGKDYIYYQYGGEHGVDSTVDPHHLAQWLDHRNLWALALAVAYGDILRHVNEAASNTEVSQQS